MFAGLKKKLGDKTRSNKNLTALTPLKKKPELEIQPEEEPRLEKRFVSNKPNEICRADNEKKSSEEEYVEYEKIQDLYLTDSHNSFLDSTSSSDKSLSVFEQPNESSKILRWKKANLIGTGGFGSVYLGLNLMSAEFFAVKEISLISDDGNPIESDSWHEVGVMQRLQHPNIVKYIGVNITKEKLSIFMEYVSGGSILNTLKQFGPLNERIAKVYTTQILLGLQYLHKEGIIHGDMKAANVLVDDKGNLKLADFGCADHLTDLKTSRRPQRKNFTKIPKGSPRWMAPEAVKQTNTGVTVSVDVWGTACTILEMLTTDPPWKEYHYPETIFYQIATSPQGPDLPTGLSAKCSDFLLKCFQREVSVRATIDTLMNHEWLVLSRSSPLNSSVDINITPTDRTK